MKTDYEKLKEITDEIDVLIANAVKYSDVQFVEWQIKAKRFLIKKYKEDSYEYKEFINKCNSLHLYSYRTDAQKHINRRKRELECIKIMLNDCLEELKEENVTPISEKASSVGFDFSKVFIVHGHDGELKHHVARIIEKQGIEPVILSEQTSQGRTIIEKFEEYSDVGGAICLFTSDDLGRSKKDDREQARARQNVVFETGYFMGKLGRKHTIILADKGVDMPSDLSGVVYTDVTDWRVAVLKELKQMGYTINLNKL